jgi:ABC-2 type transport system permease protein
MKNIWVILKREYLVRIKNKTFIIMTFLAPILIALFYGGAAYFATTGAEDNSEKRIYLSTKNQKITQIERKFDHFELINEPNIPPGGTVVDDQIIKELEEEKVQGWLIIADQDIRNLDSTQLIVKSALSLTQKEKVNAHLKAQMTKILLHEKGISQKTIDSTQVQGGISMIESTADGEQKSNTEIKSAIGFIMAFMIYIFIFIYGSMVMRSAMEEKTNRIVEVIISSVKPFELMMGKILGVALVGLTQFLGWIILSITLVLGLGSMFGTSIQQMKQMPQSGPGQIAVQQAMDQNDILAGITHLPYAQIITVFILFFLGGYLLYSSLFAAIGSAVNQETDVQQFMMPISLPLVFGFIIAQSVVFQSPNGQLAKIFSMIPLTSPVVMCVRIPFGVSWLEIFMSAAILFATFLLFVWVSGKIYRIGILMYGKKPTWKDFAKWIRQR